MRRALELALFACGVALLCIAQKTTDIEALAFGALFTGLAIFSGVIQ